MSDDKPSIDPVAILLEPGERSPVDKSEKSVAAGLVGLAYLAREAYEEKRHKQCLEATKAILKIDPEHKEASKIQSSVRTELDQEFVNAQTAARDAQLKDDRILYERAAASLRRIIDVDPDNLEARTLLHDTVAASYFRPAPPAGRPGWKIPRRAVLMASLVVVVLAVIVLMNATGWQVATKGEPPRETALAIQPDHPLAPEPAVQMPPDFSTAEWVPMKRLLGETTVPSLRMEDSDRVLRAVAPPLSLSQPRRAPDAGVAAPPMGALAVSAAVPVEIYRGEENLGSTPATIQLAEGPQTLEYRYQGLRQTLTHVITRDQTTTATVSILLKVQINAQPWAQVFIEGTNLTPLGQTPLGDVSVPIGSVLVFQSPGFPDKRYRVTARDTAIRITFP